MNSFNTFNTSIIRSIGLEVDDESYITTVAGKRLKLGGLEIVLPTDKTKKNNLEATPNGRLVKKFHLFNPYVDDDLKANDLLGKFMIKFMDARSTLTIITIMQSLAVMLGDETCHSDVHTSLQKFIVTVKNNTTKKSKLITRNTTAGIIKLSESLLTNKDYLVKYLICKGEAIDGIKYNRVSKLDPQTINNIDKIMDASSLKPSEQELFKLMIDYIIPDIPEYITGSKDKNYPTFIAVYELYAEVTTRLNFLLKELKTIVPGVYEELNSELVNISDELKANHKYISMLPNVNISKAVDNTKLREVGQPSTTSPMTVDNNRGLNLEMSHNMGRPVDNNMMGHDPVRSKSNEMMALLRPAQHKGRPGFVNNNGSVVHTSGYGGGHQVGGIDSAMANQNSGLNIVNQPNALRVNGGNNSDVW